MAVLWEYEQDGEYYVVTQAGNSIRLYRNGVHHSQWNPQRPLAGSVWDLLALPIAFRPGADAGDVAILGFGAGAAACIIGACFPFSSITGVELDPLHLSIADGFFGVGEQVHCVQADAVDWVFEMVSAGDQQFDCIIDDLYGENVSGVPTRAVSMDREWFKQLLALLAPSGTLILNHLEPEAIHLLPLVCDPEMRNQFASVKCLSLEGYDNRVLAFSRKEQSEANLHEAIRSVRKRFPHCRDVAKRYQIESLG